MNNFLQTLKRYKLNKEDRGTVDLLNLLDAEESVYYVIETIPLFCYNFKRKFITVNISESNTSKSVHELKVIFNYFYKGVFFKEVRLRKGLKECKNLLCKPDIYE